MSIKPSLKNSTLLFFHYPSAYFSRKIENVWVKVFKNGTSKICGRQPLKNLR